MMISRPMADTLSVALARVAARHAVLAGASVVPVPATDLPGLRDRLWRQADGGGAAQVALVDCGAEGHWLALIAGDVRPAGALAALEDLAADLLGGPARPTAPGALSAAMAEPQQAVVGALHLGGGAVWLGWSGGAARRVLHRLPVPGIAAVAPALLEAAWALLAARQSGRDDACYGRLHPQRGPEICRAELAGCADLGALHAAVAAAGPLGPDGLRNWAELPLRDPLLEAALADDDVAALALLADPGLPAVALSHDPAQVDPQQALSLLCRLVHLVAAMAGAEPERRLATLDMLPEAERADLLALAAPDLALPATIPCPATWFEAVAQERPAALAVISEVDGTSLSFAGLDARANALARRLRQTAPVFADGSEAVCAINLPRGLDFVVAMLAVLKCGATFLPLDMTLPETERSLRAVESGAAAVIGQEGLVGLAVPVLAPDAAELAEAPPRPAPQAGRLAYIIHTSGSTGRPKGVMGTTGALAAHAAAVIAAYGLSAADRVLQFASAGFDVALEETVPTLLAGGTLVIRSEAQAESVHAFLALLQDRGLTVLNLPASFWHVLVEEMAGRKLGLPPSVRLVVTGSERILPSALAQWQRLAPDCAWINGYGPTETTITATAHAPDLRAGPVDPALDVPIGRPLPHARAYVLAFDGSLAPRGAEGSLHIGGPAVTRGYLNQPEATAAAFGPDPYVPEGRIYNTGDRARWRADGALDFLGRRDRQVKLRGQRIDLGEIERTLCQFEGLREARVEVEAAGSDAARLIAWVCGPELTADSRMMARVVEQVARHMTGAMMPVIVPVPAFPLKPNGKIDVAALPRPGTAPAREGEAARPIDALTLAVSALVAEALGRDTVDPDEDIRDLGANSLVALRLASILEARFGRPVVTTDLYRNPTARTIARFLEVESDAPRFVVPIQTGGRQPPFFAVHVLGDKELLYRPLAAALGPDFPVYGLTVGPPTRLDDISVERIARQYFDDIQRGFPEGPICLGAVSMATYFAYELAQLLIAAGREVRVLVALDAEGPDGRPPVQGLAKLAVHLRQLGRHGLGHLTTIARFKMENRRIAQELAASTPGEVTGANLVMANVQAVEAYRPQPYPQRIVVFRAGDSFWDSPAALASSLGWVSVARGGLEMIDIPGEHLSILDAINVPHLARHLGPIIAGLR